MGALNYDGSITNFDDRLLSHLQIVIVQKLRLNQSFVMSWLNSLSVGDGRTSIWIDRTIPLRFTFDGSRVPEISREWITLLTQSADSSRGLVVMNEDGGVARSTGGAR